MMEVGSLVLSPCCLGHQAEVLSKFNVKGRPNCILICENEDCMSVTSVFKGLVFVPLEETAQVVTNRIDDTNLFFKKALSQTASKYLTALIIDDFPANANYLAYLLDSLGCHAIVHHWGSDAFERVIDSQPDVIFLDIHLPDLSGWKVLELLQNSKQTKHIPVYIVSMDYDLERALTMGAQGAIQKPVAISKLNELLKQKLQLK